MSEISNLVASHYNSIQERGIDARKESRIYYMRSFNNWIKSMLISDTIKTLKNRNLRVLDMCCGKGGDIQKWVKSKAISHIVFADIASTSVQQCQERYRNIRGGADFSAEFITADCTKESLRGFYENPNIQFDLVSVQFSFHYSFESLTQANKMLENISENLKPGGWFIGTTMNSNRIVKLLHSSNSNEFGNEVYNIRFESEEPFPLFGAKYWIKLDEVVNCPEFLVHFPTLEKLAEKHGLKLIYKKTFDEYFKDMMDEGHFLLDRMQALQTYPAPPSEKLLSDKPIEYQHAVDYLKQHPHVEKLGTLSLSEWETICLYIVFGFQKV